MKNKKKKSPESKGSTLQWTHLALRVMRSVDEVFRPVVCAEPSLVCETRRGLFSWLHTHSALTRSHSQKTDPNYSLQADCSRSRMLQMSKCTVWKYLNWNNVMIIHFQHAYKSLRLFTVFLVIFSHSGDGRELLQPDGFLSPRAQAQMCFLLVTQSITFQV